MYEKLGQIHQQNDGGSDAAAAFVEAAKCYQKTSKTGDLHFIIWPMCWFLQGAH